MTTMIAWGHNPGQWMVKDCITTGDNQAHIPAPYPAVIAPWAVSDELGLARRGAQLEAVLDGNRYIGGERAARLPLAQRQMAQGRLSPTSPLYPALAQMSFCHAGLAGSIGRDLPTVAIATALPVGWKLDQADATSALEAHIRRGLDGLAHIHAIWVRSEPAAVVFHELLDDAGGYRADQRELMTGLVCVADIGGATLNRAALEGLSPLPGQSASPALGSSVAIGMLAQEAGMQLPDAEQRLRVALRQPGADAAADRVLRQYREAVVADLQQAWKSFQPVAYLLAGGTSYWVGDPIQRAFGPRVRRVAQPQTAIATGLWRYAQRQLASATARRAAGARQVA